MLLSFQGRALTFGDDSCGRDGGEAIVGYKVKLRRVGLDSDSRFNAGVERFVLPFGKGGKLEPLVRAIE
jgi:hypothetical protein